MTPNRVLIDAGPLVALLSERQPEHEACKQVLATLRLPLFTCLPALTEAAYLLRRYPAKMRALVATADGGHLSLLPIESRDIAPINAILEKYEDQGFQFADACLMHLSQREGIETVFTLDRKDFQTFRTPFGKALTLLP